MTLADPKVFMEAMMSEMRRVMRVELGQVHERIDQIENARERQPQNVPNLRRRERVQPREVRVEDEEPYGAGFVEEDDRDSVVAPDFSSTSWKPSSTKQMDKSQAVLTMSPSQRTPAPFLKVSSGDWSEGRLGGDGCWCGGVSGFGDGGDTAIGDDGCGGGYVVVAVEMIRRSDEREKDEVSGGGWCVIVETG
ncbi:hypothetical protein F0562_025273 [Nyssa sinensis]|uniref:Uncharacterized protein n=1 Tax=Nyssa sinensis TaxID=561372 RepID=A0A5J5BG91_9ASTE|nr:hypothetical protein F0562_025273 [Nyssa sinensis]